MKRFSYVIKEIIKSIGVDCISVLIRMLYIIPIKENRIFAHSFGGKQYSCNPRAFTEYVLEHYPSRYEIIWAFKEPKKWKYLEGKGIRIVKYNSFKRIVLEVTSKVSINNCGSYSWMPLRKKQYHVNTWHAGGAYKMLQNDFFAEKNRKKTGRQTTHMLSSGKKFTQCTIEREFDFHGDILNIGMPRNDRFFNKKIVQQYNRLVRKRYNIQDSAFIVLYAPTWRFDGIIPCPNMQNILIAVKERFKREPVLMLRNHNYSDIKNENAVDVTTYPDMQDLLCAADMLITDYSSSIWDFSFTGKAGFLYVTDLDKYEKDPGLFTDINEWGYPVCRNDQELIQAILDFDEKENQQRIQRKHEYFDSYESGCATSRLCDVLLTNKGEYKT